MLILIAIASAVPVLALPSLGRGAVPPNEPAGDKPWALVTAFVTENDATVRIETDGLEAVIPKKDPKHRMTGIEEIHKVYDRCKGHTALGADKLGWRLEK